MNYAETLAYWYLRLNGFFPLARFVLHRRPANGDDARANRPPAHQEEDPCAADADLLAIRLPGVSERVGGQRINWDEQLFHAMNADPDANTIGLIVEVKGGSRNAEPGNAFTANRLADALNRFGNLTADYVMNEAHNQLQNHAIYLGTDRICVVAKVLFGLRFHYQIDQPQERDGHLAVPLRHANQFILGRLEDARKLGEWNFFPSDLFQYLIWHRELNGR